MTNVIANTVKEKGFFKEFRHAYEGKYNGANERPDSGISVQHENKLEITRVQKLMKS